MSELVLECRDPEVNATDRDQDAFCLLKARLNPL
jgi:hypothetical protein